MTKLLCPLFVVLLLFTLCVGSCGGDGSDDNDIKTSFGGITLLTHRMSPCKDNPDIHCTVAGTIKNDAIFTFSMVTIKVLFLDDEGNTVTAGIASIDNLKRGRESDFEVACPLEEFSPGKYSIEITTKK